MLKTPHNEASGAAAPPLAGRSSQSRRSSRTRRAARIFAALLITLAAILFMEITGKPGKRDFAAYWTAGKLLIAHANPYSPAKVLALEKTLGTPARDEVIMRNPPWALFLAAPLGITSAWIGLAIWWLMLAGCILLSAYLLGIPPKDRALLFLFAPVLACLGAAQTGAFLLLGLSLFLYFERSRPVLAGAALLLMVIKPHLFLVFWPVLALDCIERKRFRVLIGGVLALAATTAVALVFDPRVWPHYLAMMRSASLTHEVFPTAPMLFRLLVDRTAVWPLAVPAVVGAAWGIWYYLRRRRGWNWGTDGLILILVSVAVAPYEFFSDETVLLPAIAFALTIHPVRRYSKEALFVINGVALLLSIAGFQFTSMAHVWTPAAWLIWYLYATRGNKQPRGAGESAPSVIPSEIPCHPKQNSLCHSERSRGICTFTLVP